ncbi:MAG: hypothetical protein RR707_01640 [Comamonas sp.]
MPAFPRHFSRAGEDLPASFFCGSLDFYLALLLGYQQSLQVLVAWVALQQVRQIVQRQLGIVKSIRKLTFEALFGEKQPQGTADQHRKQRDQP